MNYIGMAFLDQLLLLKINAFIGHMCKCFGDYKINLVVTGTDIKAQLLKGITTNAQKLACVVKDIFGSWYYKKSGKPLFFCSVTSHVFRTSLLNAEYKN
jgi:hypothetical protein